MEGLPIDNVIQQGIFYNEVVYRYEKPIYVPLDESGLKIAIANEDLYAEMQKDKEKEEKEYAKTEM